MYNKKYKKYKKYKLKYHQLKYGGASVNPELIKRNSDSDHCVECGITLEKCTSDGDKECYSFHSDDNRLLGCYSQAGLCGAARTSLENGHFRLPYFTDNIDSQGIINQLNCESSSVPYSTNSTNSTYSRRDRSFVASSPTSEEGGRQPKF